MSKFFYGDRLIKKQKCMLIGLFSPLILIGASSLILDGELIWSLISIFSLFPLIALLLLMMDQGPAFWKWWITFGFGHIIEIDDSHIWFDGNDEKIQKWIKKNVKGPSQVIKPCQKYAFLFKLDAMAFKLRWL